MNKLYVLCNIIYADFFDRIRGYGFLIISGFAIFIATNIGSGTIIIRWGEYCDLNNSAYVGSSTAVIVTILFSWVCFYFVKGTLNKDMELGIGEVITVTSVNKGLYILGKSLSNFLVLSAMVGICFLCLTFMHVVNVGYDNIDFIKLIMPFLVITLPAMMVVAALAVFSETIPFMRGSGSNILYFIMISFYIGESASYSGSGSRWLGDMMGICLFGESLKNSAEGAFNLELMYKGQVKTIEWKGIQFTSEVLIERLLWVGLALGIIFAAIWLFNRISLFTGLRVSLYKQHKRQDGTIADDKTAPVKQKEAAKEKFFPSFAVNNLKYRLGQMLFSELNLLLKRIPWWWFVISAALLVISAIMPMNYVKEYMLPIVWVWPIIVWSKMGTQEKYNLTYDVVFSTPYPKYRHVMVKWLSGISIAALTGSGVLIRLFLSSDWLGILVWLEAALFISALALTLGRFSGSSKLFEGMYLLIWYYGSIKKVVPFDFMGISYSSISTGIPLFYFAFTIGLITTNLISTRIDLIQYSK